MTDQIPENNGQGLNDQSLGNYPNNEQVGQVQPDQQQESEKNNPYWDEVLNQVPSEFHSRLTPTFKKWDDNFQKVQSQYAPYKPLIEKGIQYNDIDQALQLAHYLNTNPQAVYERLHQQFGQAVEQGQQEINEEQDELNDGEFDLENDPRWIAQQEQIQQMQSFLQQQLEERQAAEIEREINNEWQAVEQVAGRQLNQREKVEIMNRAIWLADQVGPDEIPDLRKGYQNYVEFVSQVRNERPNNTAPDVLSGNGGLPVQRKTMGQMSQEERIQHIAAMAEAMSKNNQ